MFFFSKLILYTSQEMLICIINVIRYLFEFLDKRNNWSKKNRKQIYIKEKGELF